MEKISPRGILANILLHGIGSAIKNTNISGKSVLAHVSAFISNMLRPHKTC